MITPEEIEQMRLFCESADISAISDAHQWVIRLLADREAVEAERADLKRQLVSVSDERFRLMGLGAAAEARLREAEALLQSIYEAGADEAGNPGLFATTGLWSWLDQRDAFLSTGKPSKEPA